MEPSPVPYNLRSRCRVVGKRVLRRQGDSSKKHYDRRRPKLRKPLTGRIEDPLSKEERKQRVARIQKHAFIFLKESYPYPFWAMQHYNDNLKEEEEHYEISKVRSDLSIYYRKVGWLRLLHFEAKPKSLENSPNSSDSVVPAKRFFARVHEMPDGETHVSDCQLYSDPLEPGVSIAKIIPVSCRVCHLQDEASFKSKSMELRLAAKAQKIAAGEEDPTSD